MFTWTHPSLIAPVVLMIIVSWIIIVPSMSLRFSSLSLRRPSVRLSFKVLSWLCSAGILATGLLASVGYWRLGQAVDRWLTPAHDSLDRSSIHVQLMNVDVLIPVAFLVASHLIATMARIHRSDICSVEVLRGGHLTSVHATRMMFAAIPATALILGGGNPDHLGAKISSIASETTIALDQVRDHLGM